MRRKPVLLGIDAGTSGVKVCAFTPDGKMVQKEQANISVISRQPGFAELDVTLYWELVQQTVRSITSNPEISVIGIGLSTTCPTTITMDDDFNPIGNGIVYLDNRAADEARNYELNFESPEAYATLVGNRCSVSTCSASTMMWIRDHEPERWRNAKHIGMLNSFLAAKLTGDSAIDTTQASYSGIFRLAFPGDWDDELLRIADIPRSKLLRITAPSSRIGGVKNTVAEDLQLPPGTPVAIGSGDTAAAAFAIGFTDSHQAFESAGNSGVLTFVLDTPEFDPLFMNRCHVIPGLWISHGANSMMGGAIDWLRNNIISEYQDYSVINEQVKEAVPGANGVVFLPYLAGERCPIWNPHAKAVWYGLTLKNTRLDLLESVFEAGAFSLKQLRDLGQQKLGVAIDSIIAVGNGTLSDHWCQIKADVLHVNYTTTAVTDASAFGAALMGGIAAGIFSEPLDPSIPFLKPEGKTYTPTSESAYKAYMKAFATYNALYPALSGLM
ncbi:FGGY family carbohydrate kinase [Marispirochaeta sp.]|uniref:xylulokinase n=1 Tax=Marispirochaeta sp. TaxID=2038653 RepID=UPI0029C993E1|nr:FGGY family carbohydrate kinase [Marispirochaeta sp.]